jgi:hypothetical protein
MSLRVWVAGSANTAYRRQLKQDQTAVTVVADLISGDTQGAGAAIAQASASNDATGIASALTNAAALVSAVVANVAGANFALYSLQLAQMCSVYMDCRLLTPCD